MDIAAAEAQEEYDLLPDGVPAFVGYHAGSDHPSMSADETTQTQATAFAVNWLDLAFTANEAARQALLAEPPDGWSVTSKHID